MFARTGATASLVEVFAGVFTVECVLKLFALHGNYWGVSAAAHGRVEQGGEVGWLASQ